MATSGDDKIRELQTQDSDEVRGMHCEHCSILTGNNAPAEGFCVDCLEYMCRTCLMYHKMYMSNHSLQDQGSMPQEFSLENCDNHPNRLVKYYCTVCQTFACPECKAKDHKQCSDTKYLPNLVCDIEKSVEYKRLIQTVRKLIADLDDIKDQAERNLIYVDVQFNRAQSTITKHRENIISDFRNHVAETLDDFDRKVEETVAKLNTERNKLVQKLEEKERKLADEIDSAAEEVMNQIDKMASEDKHTLSDVCSQIDTLSPDIHDQSESLKLEEQAGSRCKLFMMMKQAEKDVVSVRKQVNKLQQTNNSYLYVVIPEDVNIHDGCLQSKNRYFTLRMLSSCKDERYASFRKDIALADLKLPTSCLMLHGNLLLTCECFPLLYIYKGVNHGRADTEKVKMKSEPWAMAKVGDYKIVVTFPHEEIVRMIEFDDSMAIINTDVISVGGPCYGVVCTDGTLILSYNFVFKSKAARVQILNMAGEVLKSIDKDCEGEDLFSDPHHLALSPDNTILYVSDFKKDSVTALTLDGKVKAIYKEDKFKGPSQVVVDWSGTVYVCCNRSCNVYQLTSGLRLVKVLLGSVEGVFGPTGLALCQTDNLLYVGMENSEFVKVYDLSVK